MPVMVEVDCDVDRVRRVVTLPEEIRADRDDVGHFCVYDERFVRRPTTPNHRPMRSASPGRSGSTTCGSVRGQLAQNPAVGRGFDIAADDTYARIHP